MNREIDEFIKRRFDKDSNWLNGNCYYFAFILCHRFPQLSLYYLAIMGHFVAYRVGDDCYYDWEGAHKLSQMDSKERESFISLDTIRTIDSKWYSRLMRDCFN